MTLGDPDDDRALNEAIAAGTARYVFPVAFEFGHDLYDAMYGDVYDQAQFCEKYDIAEEPDGGARDLLILAIRHLATIYDKQCRATSWGA